MKNKEDLREIAVCLLQAYDTCMPFNFTECVDPSCLDDAYELQRLVKSLRIRRGEKPIGFKIGCTSPEIRVALGMKDSIHGYLWDSEQYRNNAVLYDSQFRRLGIEGELGVWLLSTEGPPSQWLVEYEPIIELHHFTFDDKPDYRAFELVARNGIHAGVVHGNGRKRCRLIDIPLTEPLTVSIDGCVRETPILRNLVLADLCGPLATIKWLSQQLSREAKGEKLGVGHLILTATPGNIIPLNVSSNVEVKYMGLHARCSVASAKYEKSRF